MRNTWFAWTLVAGTALCACSNPSGNGNGCASTGAVIVRASDAQHFTPQTLTISRGQTVCWENDGSLTHSITPDLVIASDSSWAAYPEQTLSPGFAVLIQSFGATGDFYYHCKFHGAKQSGMYGVIQVR